MSNANPSFQFLNSSDIKHARELVYLDHVNMCGGFATIRGGRNSHRTQHKSGCETWSSVWAPDRSYLAWSSGHRMIQLIPWDSKAQHHLADPSQVEGQAGRQHHAIDCGELVHSLAFGTSSTSNHKQCWKRQRRENMLVLASGHPSGRIKLWNCETGHLLLEILDHKDIVHDLHFTPDRDCLRLASASRDGTVKLWEFDDQGDCNMYLTLKINAKHAFGCRWSPDRKHIAAVGSFKTVLLFRVNYRQVKARVALQGHHHDVVQCDFSPDGALLATASFDTQVILWDVYTHTQLAHLGHMHPTPRPIYAGGANDHYVYSVMFSSDGTHIATVGEDSYLRVWQWPAVSDPVVIASVDGGRCCSFSADSQLVAVGTNTGCVSVLAVEREGVTSLSHCCRLVIRRLVSTLELPCLPIPTKLQRYLAYRENCPMEDFPEADVTRREKQQSCSNSKHHG